MLTAVGLVKVLEYKNFSHRESGFLWVEKHKSWFYKKRKQAKLQWLQKPSQINVDNLSSIRVNTVRTFKKRKKRYLEDKINEWKSKNQSTETSIEA